MSVALDRGVTDGQTDWYRLRAASGATTYMFGPIEATAGEAIRSFALGQAQHNPSGGPTHVGFAVPRAAHVTIGVYDMQGHRVAVLADGMLPMGRHEAMWDGQVGGRLAPIGVYFVRLRAPGVNLSHRLVLAR